MTANVQKVFQNGEEVTNRDCFIKGSIPQWLQGEVLRNGPGEFDLGETTFDHFFDGHALLHRFSIKDGSVTYSSKFIRSETFEMNRKHNRVVYGTLGTPSYPDPCQNLFSRFFTKLTTTPPRDNCNVNVADLNNALYAITDVGHAYKFDPDTLDTQTFIDMNEICGVPVATAHPHYDSNGDYYNLGTSFGRESFYNIIRVPVEAMNTPDPMKELKVFARAKVIGNSMKPAYMHSFVLTENFFVIHDHFVRFNVLKFFKSNFTWDSPLSCFEEDKSRGSYFHVIDRSSRAEHPVTYQANPRFCFHHINGYEIDQNGMRYLVVDMMAADRPTVYTDLWDLNVLRTQSNPNMPGSTTLPYRFVLPLDVKDCTVGTSLVNIEGYKASAKLQDDGSVFLEPELLVEETTSSMELPRINYSCNGRKHKYFYAVAQRDIFPCDHLVKVNADTKEVVVWKEKDCVPSEPIFVQRPGGTDEDDGIILSTVINLLPDQPIFLVMLDAKTFTEIARAEVNVALPLPLHGRFQMAH